MSINTKEQLKSHIHKIHNLIRNSGAGYGLDAFKIFNFFYGLKMLEPFWDEYELASARFSQLVAMAEKATTPEKELRIHDELFGNNLNQGDKKYKQGCLYELNENNELRKIIVSKINEALKTNFYKQIILEINKIPTVNNKKKSDIIGDKFDVDIKGKTYEYFIGRDKQAISDLGAYFSDRHFTNFAIDIVAPELTEDKVPLYIDPFGGSGGFTIQFVNYLKTKYPKLKWNKDNNIDSINHYDMSEVVVKSCALEIFALTGKIPDMKEYFQIGNSFKADFGGLKYKYIFSNPPFGGSVAIDTNSETYKKINKLKNDYYSKVECDNGKEVYRWTEDWAESQYGELKDILDFEISEIKEQQVNWETCGKRIREYCIKYDEDINKKYKNENSKDHKELIKTFQIKDKCNDKEACSLIMFMELLDANGVAAIIIKEGVLFDSKYSSIRKCLVDNYNITHIISIPQDAFENTSTKTSIIIFKNNGKTEKIKFSELKVEKEIDDIFEIITNDKGEMRLELIAHKDQIKKVSDEIKAYASYNEISKSSLKSTGKSNKLYWAYSLNYKDYLKDETFCPEGYKLMKLGDICKISNGERIVKKDCKDGNIPVYGGGDISFYTDKYNRDGTTIVISRFAMSKKCVRIIKGKIFLNDSAISISSEDKNLEIYLGNYLESNMDKVIYCSNASVQKNLDINQFKNLQIPIPNDITKLKPQLIKLSKTHSKISDLTEQIPQKEKAISDLIDELTSNGEEGKDWDEYKLGDMCRIFGSPGGEKLGKFARFEIKNNELNNDNYGFIRGADIIDNDKILKYYIKKNDYEIYYKNTNTIVKHNDILMTACSQNMNYCIIPMKWNNYPYHGCLKFTDIKINIKYLIYYMNIDSFINNILNLQNGSVVKYSNASHFQNSKIKILKDKILSKHKLQDKFDEVDKMKDELEKTKKTYQEEIVKLMEPFKIDVEDGMNDNLSNKSANTTKTINSEKSKQIKSIKSDTNTNSNSDSDTNSDSDDGESELKKSNISKSDLIELKKITKDGYTHWFNPKSNEIYSFNMKTSKWIKAKPNVKIYDIYSDEIKEIIVKSSKDMKEKKNKSTKSKVIVKETKENLDDNLTQTLNFIATKSNQVKGQTVSKYKTKTQSNAKYISDSDSEDLDELEKKFESKK